MIAFDLECSKGHIFEGWFYNIKSFEEQDAKDMISCPNCNDTKIKRILSPVSVKNSSAPDTGKGGNAIDYKKLAKEIVDYIHDKFEDLGPRFATEALKIHYGIAKERNIRGSATESEEKLLKEEGIQFFKIPVIKPDDDKKD